MSIKETGYVGGGPVIGICNDLLSFTSEAPKEQYLFGINESLLIGRTLYVSHRVPSSNPREQHRRCQELWKVFR